MFYTPVMVKLRFEASPDASEKAGHMRRRCRCRESS